MMTLKTRTYVAQTAAAKRPAFAGQDRRAAADALFVGWCQNGKRLYVTASNRRSTSLDHAIATYLSR